MSKKYPGGIVRGTPITPTTSAASGIWTACQAANYTKQGIWPRSPGAPTIGAASISSGSTTASVAFTAPSDTGSASITAYTAVSTPGCITGTGASSPVSVSGLTVGTAYTFQVKATNGAGTGPLSGSSNSITPTAVVGQQAYTCTGTYTWVAPTGVTSVSVVAVGGGGRSGCNTYYGAGGGELRYKNNLTVVPGNSYSVQVGIRAQASKFNTTSVIANGGADGGSGGAGGSGGTGDGGGNGGNGGGYFYGTCFAFGAGGGAGGYSGNGGNGGNHSASCSTGNGTNGTAGSGGGGGGGGGGANRRFLCCGSYVYLPRRGGGGGGVGILGQGSNGTGGTGTVYAGNCTGTGGGGGGGSGGGSGFCGGQLGGLYGGGSAVGGGTSGNFGTGAVRIIWPGNTRTFPSTCTGNL